MRRVILIASTLLNPIATVGRPKCAAIAALLGSAVVMSLAVQLGAQAAPARKFSRTVDQRLVIGEHDGTELLNPRSIVADREGGFYLYDAGEHQILAFSRTGSLRWRAGRRGAGPGEYLGVGDLEVGRRGDVHILDGSNARITILSSSGSLKGSVSLPSQMRRLLPPLLDGQQLVVPHGAFVSMTLSLSGVPVREHALPSGVAFPADITGEPYTAALDSGAVIAYRWSSTLVLLRPEGSVRLVSPGVERIPFPSPRTYDVTMGSQKMKVTRVDPNAVPAAVSVTGRRNKFCVLFRGATSARGRIVDFYDGMSGQYEGSLTLPHAVAEIAWLSDGRLATLELEPLPVVRIWNVGWR